jgi:hypothetical protein
MRCPDCNKFASFDDSNEPEADDANVDDEGRVTGNVRVYLTCAECSTELKEASFELEADFSEAVEAHKKAAKEKDDDAEKPEDEREEHDLDVEVECEMASRTVGKGRGMKTFYGYHATVSVSCSCGHKFADEERDDDMQASHMDELT